MSDHATTPDSDHAHGDHHHGPHVVPLSLLFGVFGILMVLTFATVGATYIDLGTNLNLTLAIFIAVVKAAYVALYFMHLRWDSPFNGLILVASFVFLALFISFTIVDSGQYSPNVNEQKAEEVQKNTVAP